MRHRCAADRRGGADAGHGLGRSVVEGAEFAAADRPDGYAVEKRAAVVGRPDSVENWGGASAGYHRR